MKKIPLTQGFTALVDDDDFERLLESKWHYDGKGYASRNIKKGSGVCSSISMHVQIMCSVGGLAVDHINGNGLDNRRKNLRLVTGTQNQQNQKPNRCGCSSQYKGVCWNKARRKWQATIKVDKKLRHLGCFERETDAALAYNAAATKYFGKYARLNVIETA